MPCSLEKTVAVTDTPAVGCSTKWAYKSANVEKEDVQFNQRPVALDLISAAQLTKLRQNAGTDKLLLVNVWATWCGPCVKEFPELETMVPYVWKPATPDRDVEHQQP